MRIFSRQWFQKGAGEFAAYFRMGLQTAQDATHPWNNPQVASTPGTAGSPTIQSVHQEINPDGHDPVALWAGRAQEQAKEMEREKGKDKAPDVEM